MRIVFIFCKEDGRWKKKNFVLGRSCMFFLWSSVHRFSMILRSVGLRVVAKLCKTFSLCLDVFHWRFWGAFRSHALLEKSFSFLSFYLFYFFRLISLLQSHGKFSSGHWLQLINSTCCLSAVLFIKCILFLAANTSTNGFLLDQSFIQFFSPKCLKTSEYKLYG